MTSKIRERNFNYLLSLGRRAKGESTPNVNKIIALSHPTMIIWNLFCVPLLGRAQQT